MTRQEIIIIAKKHQYKIIFGLVALVIITIVCTKEQVFSPFQRNSDANRTTGINYYISTLGSDVNNGTSMQSPWKTITKANSSMGIFQPGDSILFKKGEIFTGKLNITRSGSMGNPLYFGSSDNFGTGVYPVLTNAVGSIIGLSNVSFVTVNAITITDPTMDQVDRTIQAKIGYAVSLTNSQSNTLSNLDISLVGVCIEVTNNSTLNTISGCYFHNGRMVVNTPVSVNATDDYGANGVVLTSSNNTITNCRFDGLWAQSYDFGKDGGAIEVFGGYSNNSLLYSTINDCNGVCEFGTNGGGAINNTLVAYCKLTNNGLLSYFSTTNLFASQVSNAQYFNNTVVETVNSFNQTSLFGFSGTPTVAIAYNLRNNIFYISDGAKVMRSGNDAAKYNHLNNIYVLSNGSATNYPLNSTELQTTSNVFNPDYSLINGSAAIDFGQNLGYNTHDLAGVTIVGLPDAGCYEYGNVAGACIFKYGNWSGCMNSKQTRTYTSSIGCLVAPPADSISRVCVVLAPCLYTYGKWTTCMNANQTRSYTFSGSCSVLPPTDSINRACTLMTGCVFVYANWGDCSNSLQVRNYTSSAGCNPPTDSTIKSCLPVNYFYFNKVKSNLWIDCNIVGVLIIRSSTGNIVKSVSYPAYGFAISVSGLRGTYTASTQGLVIKFTR